MNMTTEADYEESEEDFHERCRVHERLIREYNQKALSASPLHQARAAKDPDYWTLHSFGRWNIPGIESPVRRKKNVKNRTNL
jgi:hypothetical protein